MLCVDFGRVSLAYSLICLQYGGIQALIIQAQIHTQSHEGILERIGIYQ